MLRVSSQVTAFDSPSRSVTGQAWLLLRHIYVSAPWGHAAIVLAIEGIDYFRIVS